MIFSYHGERAHGKKKSPLRWENHRKPQVLEIEHLKVLVWSIPEI